MPGLSLAADADSVIEWLDRLSPDETVFDDLAAIDGAELSLGERMSNLLIKAAGVPWVTESHHRLALRLLMVGADPNRPSWKVVISSFSGTRSGRIRARRCRDSTGEWCSRERADRPWGRKQNAAGRCPRSIECPPVSISCSGHHSGLASARR